MQLVSLQLRMIASDIHLVVQHPELVSGSLVLSGRSALTASHNNLSGTILTLLFILPV